MNIAVNTYTHTYMYTIRCISCIIDPAVPPNYDFVFTAQTLPCGGINELLSERTLLAMRTLGRRSFRLSEWIAIQRRW